jgi:hypothetical protein
MVNEKVLDGVQGKCQVRKESTRACPRDVEMAGVGGGVNHG